MTATAIAQWKTRLHAWWEGYDLLDSAQETEPEAEVQETDLPKHDLPTQQNSVNKGWSEARVALNENLWGEGFLSPGGEDVIAEMIAPLGLTKEHSVVDLGAGIGGAARCISKLTGAWVSGYEEDEELARLGMERSTMAGMARKTPVVQCDLATLKIRRRTIDCAFSKEALFTVADKTRVFEAIHTMLKIEGHLLFTDLIAARDQSSAPATEVWAAHEPRPPALCRIDDVTATLEKIGFDVRITEDITDAYQERVIAGFSGLLARMKKPSQSPEITSWEIAETEHWARRIAVLDSGEVKIYRVYARVPLPRSS